MLPDDQLATRRFCRQAWDVHEARGRTISFTSTWPGPRDFRRHWPGLAGNLTVADWKVRESATFSAVLEVDWEVLDPPAPEERDWAVLYSAELETLPGLHFHLVPTHEGDVGGVGRAVDWVMKQLRHLPVREQTALRLWLGGDSRSQIARTLSRYGHGVRPDQVARILDVDAQGRPRALREFLAARRASRQPDSADITQPNTP